MSKKIERQSNFELMRLVSMFFIVIWHIMVHGELFNDVEEPLILISNIITGIIILHVNSLIFITGYFSCEKQTIDWKKAGRLLGTVWLYKVGILMVFLIGNLYPISKVFILEEILPLDVNNYWFINYYLVLLILIPYLNRVIENFKEKEFTKFIGILILLLSIIPAITNCRTISNNGYTLMNMILMYYLGAYFKKYPLEQNYYLKKLSKKQIKWILLGSFFGLIFIRISIYYFSAKLLAIPNNGINWFGEILKNDFFRYSSPLVILQTCLYCLWFECIEIKSKVINFCAKSVLGIYLIHDNYLLRLKIYKWLKVAPTSSTLGTLKVLFLSAIIIYISCFVIETIRRFLVKFLEIVYTKIKQWYMKTITKGEN